MDLKSYTYTADYSRLSTKNIKNYEKEKSFNLIDPSSKRLYFNYKVGEEIEFLRDYLSHSSFVGYLISPKMAGKGTYTNILRDILGPELFSNISAGDVVRKADEDFASKGKQSDYYLYAKKYYRGFMDIEKSFEALTNRTSDKVSVPTELMLTLMKYEIDQLNGKAVFIDGFPRKVDQVSYSLYFRDLINHRDDPDFVVLINIPLEIINARILGRRTCPVCRNSCNLNLKPTSIVEYDEKTKEYILICDSSICKDKRVVLERKEGDEKGIDIIKDRIADDLDLMNLARNMYGIPKIEIYNSLEKDIADKYCDDYELTKEFSYSIENGKVKMEEKPFEVDVKGEKYVSFLPEPVLVSMIRQMVAILKK